MSPFILDLTYLQIKSGDFFSAEGAENLVSLPSPLGNLHSPLSE